MSRIETASPDGDCTRDINGEQRRLPSSSSCLAGIRSRIGQRGLSPAKTRATTNYQSCHVADAPQEGEFDPVDSCAWSKEPPVPPWVTSYGRVIT